LRILISGGAGFIGSHVSEAFLKYGHEVLAVDNLFRGKKENLPEAIPVKEIDIRDRKALSEVFDEFRPDLVNHHAAQVSVRESVDDPAFDADVNILGSLNLLDCCIKHQTGKFVFASTGGAIYGEQEKFPAPEEHQEKPLSPYAVSKLAVEKYLYFYEKTYGLKWVSLRYANVYGPRQDPFGEAGVVAIFCQKMLADGQPVINGDGLQTRDFVYVEDVARANLASLHSNFTGPVNIGTGEETDINRIFHFLAELTGSKAEENHGPAKPGEQRRSVLDPGLAEKVLLWEPEVSLREGLKRTVEFFRENS